MENGGVHRACGGDLRTGTQYGFKPAGGSWSNSTFDPEDSTYVALAVDPSGRPHIAYTLNHYQARKVIKYAFKTPSGVWSIDETLTLPAEYVDVGMSVSLALDAARGLHLSYSNIGQSTGSGWIDGALMYAFKPAGGSWSTSKMPKEASYAALAVDAAGGAYIAYHYLGFEYLYKPAGGSWSLNRIDPSTGHGYPSIAIDTSGILHVVYYAGGLTYARICPTS